MRSAYRPRITVLLAAALAAAVSLAASAGQAAPSGWGRISGPTGAGGQLGLASLSARRAAAAFPGDNGKIAFRGGQSARGIWVMNPDGSGETQLTTATEDADPAWSADGNKIAFTDASGIAVMNADGTGRTQLTTGFDSHASWSPDGKRIAFQGQTLSTPPEVELMNADGTGRKALAVGEEPAWSPDGKTIAFLGDPSGIFTIAANGSGLTRLTSGAGDRLPSWSPDGSRIVFSSNDGLMTMDADGSALTQVMAEYNSGAAWSPDGSKIAFTEPVGGTSEVFTINPYGSGKTQLTFDSTGDYEVDWQPLTATPPFSDLALRMAGPRHIGPGDPITYTIRVRNDGPGRADGVVVTDPLPAGTQFIRAFTSRGSCTPPDPASGALVCSLGSMGDGSHRTIIVVCRATVSAGTTLTNVATVSSLSRDPNDNDNSATIVTQVGR